MECQSMLPPRTRTGLALLLIFAIFASVTTACNETQTRVLRWVHLSSTDGNLPAPGLASEQTALLVLDVDGDGIDDAVIGARRAAPSLVWYKRTGTGWVRHVIDAEILPIEAGGAFHDIDGDGDLDIVMGEDSDGNKIYWWANPYPNYDSAVPWTRREIKNSGSNKHHDQMFGDFDGDGRTELVFWNQKANKLFRAEVPNEPKGHQPWTYTEIFSSASESEGLGQTDIDGDGKTDIVGGGRWFKYAGDGRFTPNVIDDKQRFTRAAAGQLKKGGWAEVVFVCGDCKGPLKWYEWTGKRWVGHDLLGFEVNHGHSLEVADIDGDGNSDIFCAEMRSAGSNPTAKMWIFYGDGKGNFRRTEVSTGYDNHESKLADLDGDGDIDIVSKPYRSETPRIDLWLNKGRILPLDHWQRQVIDFHKPWTSIFITAADMDGDRKKDIITGGWWYRNSGVLNGPWTRNTIGSPLNNMAVVYDFDNDGDIDVLGTEGEGSSTSASFVWARNDGSGTFAIFHNVSKAQGDFLQGAAVGQFQKHDPLEIALSWHKAGQGIQILTVPPNPSSGPWPWRKTSVISQDEALSAGDIDGDGDLDLLLGTKWLRNDGQSWSLHDLYKTTDNPDRNRLTDINGDGKLDAVVGFEAVSRTGKVVWYEQPTLPTAMWIEHMIGEVVGPMSLDVGDLDNDGDLDVVVGEHNLSNPSQARLYLFENLDGWGKKWNRHMIHTGDEHHDGTQLMDIDGDGDLDIISIGWGHSRVLLYENTAIARTPDLN
jgi:FG-GAP-like repeat/FG-GAP repeat